MLECSQNRRIITNWNLKLWLETLGSLLYTWILSWTVVLSTADKLYTTLDDTDVMCDHTYCQVTYICPLYILRPPKFWHLYKKLKISTLLLEKVKSSYPVCSMPLSFLLSLHQALPLLLSRIWMIYLSQQVHAPINQSINQSIIRKVWRYQRGNLKPQVDEGQTIHGQKCEDTKKVIWSRKLTRDTQCNGQKCEDIKDVIWSRKLTRDRQYNG